MNSRYNKEIVISGATSHPPVGEDQKVGGPFRAPPEEGGGGIVSSSNLASLSRHPIPSPPSRPLPSADLALCFA